MTNTQIRTGLCTNHGCSGEDYRLCDYCGQHDCIIFITILREVSGITIGGIVELDIFFLAFISGASMKPARSLAPALVSGVLNNLWIY
ncbi:MAG: aquaporin [Nitrososphaeraceae archaeon]